ncbi:MAG: TetR/AcrR family transcriptional regulator [Bacillota bacterium]
MYERFDALDAEKRQRILEACIGEFAAKGYVKANTNEIVKKAGISKGLLFHYFGSKKRLYLYIVDHALKTVSKALEDELGSLPGEYFEMVAEVSAMKMRMAFRYPMEYRILLDAYFNTPDELKDDIGREYATIFEKQKEKCAAMMDKSRLRDDVSPEQAFDLIYACAQGVFNPIVNTHEKMTLEEAMEKIEQYRKEVLDLLHLLKRAIYKE